MCIRQFFHVFVDWKWDPSFHPHFWELNNSNIFSYFVVFLGCRYFHYVMLLITDRLHAYCYKYQLDLQRYMLFNNRIDYFNSSGLVHSIFEALSLFFLSFSFFGKFNSSWYFLHLVLIQNKTNFFFWDFATLLRSSLKFTGILLARLHQFLCEKFELLILESELE